VHKKYNLRSKKSNDNLTKKYYDFKKTTDTTIKKFHDNPPKKNSEAQTKRVYESVSKTDQTDIPSTIWRRNTSQKNVVEKTDPPNQNKTPGSFSLESELEKLKIPIPLTKLMNKNSYRSKVIKALNIEPTVGIDTMKIVDD